MRARVSVTKWDIDLQQYVTVPLDDAYPEVIELARVLAQDDNRSVDDVLKELGYE